MESLNKKTSPPLSFASAAAAAAGKATATSAAGTATSGTGTSTPSAKNGSHPSTAQASPVLGPAASTSKPQSGKTSTVTTTANSPTTPVAPTNGLEWILEKPVRVVTTADEIFEGKVYAYDVTMNCLCPSKSVSAAGTPTTYYSPSLGNNNTGNNGNAGARPKYDFRILKLNYIKDVTPLESLNTSQNKPGTDSPKPEVSDSKEEERPSNNSTQGSTYASVLPAVGYVQMDKIQQKEQQAVREAHAAAARIGVGVSTIAQDIFDALSKTWAKDSIVVMDEVIIAPPYEPENCKANASSSYTLARVKKVLEGERSRLANGRK